jgi:hypothetical protein
VQFVVGRAKHLVSAKIFGNKKFRQWVALCPKIKIPVGVANTDFVYIKRNRTFTVIIQQVLVRLE